jgi:hypothetical protein
MSIRLRIGQVRRAISVISYEIPDSRFIVLVHRSYVGHTYNPPNISHATIIDPNFSKSLFEPNENPCHAS